MNPLARVSLGCALAFTVSFGCTRPPTPPPRVAPKIQRFEPLPVEPDARRLLGPDASRAEAAGAANLAVVAIDGGSLGDRVDGVLHVPAASCALLYARAAKSVEDIDLFVYADDGAIVASDEGPDKTPTVIVCPPHPARLYVMARVAAGHGLVAIGGMEVAPTAAARVGSAVGARNDPDVEERRAATWPDLEERLTEHRRFIGARWQDVRRAPVPLDARMPTRATASVDAGHCLDVLLLPSEEVAYLDLSALDLDGRIVARASATGRERSLILCSPVDQIVTLAVRPHAGRGIGILLLSRTEEGTEPDIDPALPITQLLNPVDLETARGTLAQALQKNGYSRPSSVATGALTAGTRSSVKLKLEKGCSRIDVLTGAPGRGVSAWLWSARARAAVQSGVGANTQVAADAEDLLAEGSSFSTTTLFVCGAAGGARLDLEPLGPSGSYAAEVRRETETPTVLEHYPLAASRLLSRMLARGTIRAADQIGAAQPVHLAVEQLKSIPLMIPVGRCLDVNLALGAGAGGAEIRIVETPPEQNASIAPELLELARARGNQSASARACALERRDTVHARAELRIAAGATDALVATRLLSPQK